MMVVKIKKKKKKEQQHFCDGALNHLEEGNKKHFAVCTAVQCSTPGAVDAVESQGLRINTTTTDRQTAENP